MRDIDEEVLSQNVISSEHFSCGTSIGKSRKFSFKSGLSSIHKQSSATKGTRGI